MVATTDVSGLRNAAAVAIQFVQALLADERVGDFRFEEFAESADAQRWLITVGFLRDEVKQPVPWLTGIPMRVRDQKVVVIDKATGTPMAMRNRESD